jgi:type I restriction enzyme S subunit
LKALETGIILEQIEKFKGGAAQQNLSLAQVRDFCIVLPPLPEQHRIVALLDEAFAGLATAKANAEQNLQNARAIFEGHLQAVFNQRGEGWEKTTVKGLARPGKGSIRTGPFGSQLLHSEFVDEGIAVLGIDNAVANYFRWGKDRFITKEKYQQLERYTVHPGDVLITIMGTCGRCAVVPDDIPTAINTKHLCCITVDKEQCLPGYLHLYFLYSPQSQEYLLKFAKGAIMAGLNMGIIQDLPIYLPPLQVQEELIGVANVLREETQHLTRLYGRKLAALEELKKSLLYRAFNGEL